MKERVRWMCLGGEAAMALLCGLNWLMTGYPGWGLGFAFALGCTLVILRLEWLANN